MDYLLLYLVLINALAFVLMLADKQKAKRNLWRIPEATLMATAAIGGSLGAFLAMRLFRHKTRHLRFSVGLPLLMLLHGALLFLWYRI
jgi:uncharacterized membrane protein YsdA (DUF1294 family)